MILTVGDTKYEVSLSQNRRVSISAVIIPSGIGLKNNDRWDGIRLISTPKPAAPAEEPVAPPAEEPVAPEPDTDDPSDDNETP